MKQRASTDGCLNYIGVPTDGCSQLYVGDIEIRFQNVAASQISHEHKYEDRSHEYEEFSIENIEYHFETHPTFEMKQRPSVIFLSFKIEL